MVVAKCIYTGKLNFLDFKMSLSTVNFFFFLDVADKPIQTQPQMLIQPIWRQQLPNVILNYIKVKHKMDVNDDGNNGILTQVQMWLIKVQSTLINKYIQGK